MFDKCICVESRSGVHARHCADKLGYVAGRFLFSDYVMALGIILREEHERGEFCADVASKGLLYLCTFKGVEELFNLSSVITRHDTRFEVPVVRVSQSSIQTTVSRSQLNQMDHAVSLVDLLYIILSYGDIDEKTLARSARVCRAWFEPAIRNLWKTLDNLSYLFELLPKNREDMRCTSVYVSSFKS